MFTRLKVCCASYERKQTDKINNFSCRYLDYSSTQNSKEKVSEVSDIQKGLCKHDYEIDVVEEILPLQRVRVLVRCTISRLSPSLCFGWVGLRPTLPIQNTESLSQAKISLHRQYNPYFVYFDTEKVACLTGLKARVLRVLLT